MLRSLLALSDVMSTGHRAAVCAGVKKGGTVAVVGDGAVGLCAVLASRRLGAETDLGHIADACRAMNEHRAIKSLVRVGAVGRQQRTTTV